MDRHRHVVPRGGEEVVAQARLGGEADGVEGTVEAAPPLAQRGLEGLAVGLVTSGNGCAAAIRAMSREPEFIAALVCRGGRPGLAGADPLRLVQSPACMIVGERDEGIAGVRQAYELLGGPKAWREIPGTDGLFREPGTLDEAASHAADWFLRHLPPPAGQAPAMTA